MSSSGLGHLAIQFANKMGYRTVALSSSGSKKDLAMKLGAHDYLDGSKVDQAAELQKLGGAKVIVGEYKSARYQYLLGLTSILSFSL